MDLLNCKNCGCEAVSPMEVELSDIEDGIFPEDDGFVVDDVDDFTPEELDQILDNTEKETRFYTCQVCGDNWLSIKESSDNECEITFIHQMGIKPALRRVALMSTSIVLNENTVENWEYYFGEDLIDADDWHKRLKGRRQVLKSICSN